MNKVINIEKCFERFDDTFSPKIIAEVNSQEIKVVRLEGEKVPWHTHENEDELFYVIEGELEILEREKSVLIKSGEFYVVKKGVEHRVSPKGHVKVMLIESKGIAHTGKVKSEITLDKYEHLD